jgi:hypothetical protein
MYESSGSVARRPHESPATKHSTALAQNCKGAEDGHGPAWQVATRLCVAQQTRPAGQSPALEQDAPPVLPELASLPPDAPVGAPELLDP